MPRSFKPRPQNYQPPKLCGGKHCYRTRQEAEMVVDEKHITNPEIKLDIYHCTICCDFHLTRTNKPPTKHR